MIVTKEKSLSNADIATNTEQFILVNSPEFLKALRKVVNATAGEECPHPILQYVHVRIESDCLIIEACDSLVLDLLTVSASVDPELIGKDFLISKSFAKSLVKTPHKYGSRLSIRPSMNYTPTKVGGFWEHEVVFRMLYQYSEYLTYRTSFSYQG